MLELDYFNVQRGLIEHLRDELGILDEIRMQREGEPTRSPQPRIMAMALRQRCEMDVARL
jgi:hypothetical protein